MALEKTAKFKDMGFGKFLIFEKFWKKNKTCCTFIRYPRVRTKLWTKICFMNTKMLTCHWASKVLVPHINTFKRGIGTTFFAWSAQKLSAKVEMQHSNFDGR